MSIIIGEEMVVKISIRGKLYDPEAPTEYMIQIQETMERAYRAYLLADLAFEAEKALLSFIVGAIAVMVISNIKLQCLTIARQRASWQVSGRGKVNND